MTKYYLDANICISYLRKPYGAIADKINSLSPDDIKLPSIVKGELLFGAYKSSKVEENLKQTLDFCEPFEIVPFDNDELMTYGKIRASLELKGQKIGANDTIIAATVLTHNGTLITNNTKEFSRIEGLSLQDWTEK